MLVREIEAKSILTKSKLTDYCINCYMGCGFGCKFCYAQLIIRKFRPGQTWGEYVDVKVNAPKLLEKEIAKARRGTVMLSSVTDPYQPLEGKYQLTRQCLEILLQHGFPITVLTRSPLVTRDIELLKKFKGSTFGVSITTNDDSVKNLFEPRTPTFKARIETLKALHDAGLETYAFIGPMLKMDARTVGEAIAPLVKHVYIDRPNYPQLWKYIAEQNNLDFSKEYFERTKDELADIFKAHGVKINALF